MKKKISIRIVLGIFALSLITACADTYIEQGNRHYDNMSYAKAINYYEKVFSKNPTPEIGSKLADSYFKTGKVKEAEDIYGKVLTLGGARPSDHFNYARVLMQNQKYNEAKVVLENYLIQNENDAVALMLLSSINSIDDRYRDTTLYRIKQIETEEFANAFSATEYQEGIIFVADKEVFLGQRKNPWTGTTYLDIYKMEKDEDGTWLKPELLEGDINGRYHEGPAAFTSDGEVVYFTRSNYLKRKLIVNEDQVNNLKIFKATMVEGEWKNLDELPFNSDDYSVGHPTLSPNDSTMYFVSDMPGGHGGTDLYMTTLSKGDSLNPGTWSEPVNLGATLNTPGNEMFPYYHSDGTLYFSSDAHNTMGGLDVFLTYNDGARWATPENLNYPINSNRDDFGFIMNDTTKTGFVTSTRSDQDRIYEFNKEDPKFNLIGFAHKKGTDIPVEGVNVEITTRATGEVKSVQSDEKGYFKIKLVPETEYDLLCTKMGCFSRTDFISTKGLIYSQDFYADFEVEEIVIDKPIVLENIYYDFDKWFIRPDAAVELDKLAKLLKDNPNIDIEMGSHCDVRGSDAYNQVLSDKRAHAAVDYLISRGIEKERLTWKGYGESILVNECKNDVYCSEEKHQENRRTEFKVTKIRNGVTMK